MSKSLIGSTKWTLMLGAAAVLGGCVSELSEDVSQVSQAVTCEPRLDGAYPMMASLAIALGNELERFEATTDLVFSNHRVRLTPTALARCSELGVPGCENVQAALDLQEAPLVERNGQRLFDPVQYQQQLRVYLERQQIAETRPCNQADSAWCATHTVSLSHTTIGVCALDFWYRINILSCEGDQCDPTRLSTKLIFAGYPENGYLHPTYDLAASPPMVGIDPAVFSMVGGVPPPMAGGCVDSLVLYDPAQEHLGACCTAGGVTGELVEATWNDETLFCAAPS